MKKISPWIVFALLMFIKTASAHEGHEHMATDFSKIQWGLQGAKEVMNVHPLFVHFPIALLLESLAFYSLGTVFRKEELLKAGKWALYFGTLAAAITVWTGLQAANTVPHGGEVHAMIMVHQYLGFTVFGLSIILSAWLFLSKSPLPSKGRILFLTGLVLLALILTQGADFGGRMVFLHGVGVGRKSMLNQEAATPHEHGGEPHEHHAP